MLGRDRRNKEAAIQALRAYPGGMQVGGGIDPSNAKEYLERGASHVIVTSYVFKNGHIDFGTSPLSLSLSLLPNVIYIRTFMY